MKKISFFTPCFNEEGNVRQMYIAVKEQMQLFSQYEYEHIFSDNASTDKTADILQEIAAQDPCVKVILNNRNFGPARSGAYGFFHCTGDANICLACDFQDPPELIPQFITQWEKGHKVVWGKKISTQESRLMSFARNQFYKIIKRFSSTPQYDHITGFGLYDREVLDLVISLDDPFPSFRHLVAEFGYDVAFVEYDQPLRRAGKSSYTFFSYLSMAIKMLITTSQIPLKMATFLGFLMSGICFLIALVYFILKVIFWNSFFMGTAPIVIGLFFLGSLQLVFVGIIGEYIGEILSRVTRRPLVVAREKINFQEEKQSVTIDS